MTRLDEIQARLDAATPDGPKWFYDDPNMMVWDPSDDDAEQVAQAVGTADGLLIANAPTDVAYLLERVRRLEVAVKNWEIWANHLDLSSREDYE